MLREPTIGLALGSGGARGFAHLGALKVLQEENIPVSLLAGCSMGALVGSLYAVGHEMESMYKIAKAFQRKYYLDFTVPKMGFISGNRVKQLIHMFSKGQNIEDLAIPFAVIATDIETAEKVVFTKGPIADAVRASISIPGIFVPVELDGRLLVDGGVVDRVPASVVKEMGADIVVAIDVSYVKTNEGIDSIFDVILQTIDIMQNELVKKSELEADVMVRPPVAHYSSRAFTNIEEIIQIGEEEMRKHIPFIRQAVENWKERQVDEK